MAIYELGQNRIEKINAVSYGEVNITERGDLQRLLKNQIDVIDDNVLIIAEEFGQWEDAKRRIDLLGLDKDANLVVIELKRTQDGGHMELQAIRYAAMVSTMTFEKAVDVYSGFLTSIQSDEDAQESILKFLEWDEPDEELFAQDVRILLVSAEFSKELTTSVIWLNERDMDIRCIRMKPYSDKGRILIDVQQVIPLPEAADHIVKIKEKQQKEKASRVSGKDYTRFDISLNGQEHKGLSKRSMVFKMVRFLCDSGISPEKITVAADFRPNHLFRSVSGKVSSVEFIKLMKEIESQTGRRFDKIRYFCSDDELIFTNGSTYAMWNQWGKPTFEVMKRLADSFPEHKISCTASMID